MNSFTFVPVRRFMTSCTKCKSAPIKLKGKSTSSQNWLLRQFSDPYVEKAKFANYRCRSAFKLLEIDDKHQILKPGMVAVDIGAAPGSWTQVCVLRTNSDKSDKAKPFGTVIAIDLKPIYPLDGAILLDRQDFTIQETKDKIKSELRSKGLLVEESTRCVDVVLSDMAPNATGVKFMDHDKIIEMAYDVLRFAISLSVENGTLLVKLFNGGTTKKFVNDILKFYSTARYVKPNSSRSDSTELFILATGFKGVKR